MLSAGGGWAVRVRGDRRHQLGDRLYYYANVAADDVDGAGPTGASRRSRASDRWRRPGAVGRRHRGHRRPAQHRPAVGDLSRFVVATRRRRHERPRRRASWPRSTGTARSRSTQYVDAVPVRPARTASTPRGLGRPPRGLPAPRPRWARCSARCWRAAGRPVVGRGRPTRPVVVVDVGAGRAHWPARCWRPSRPARRRCATCSWSVRPPCGHATSTTCRWSRPAGLSGACRRGRTSRRPRHRPDRRQPRRAA